MSLGCDIPARELPASFASTFAERRSLPAPTSRTNGSLPQVIQSIGNQAQQGSRPLLPQEYVQPGIHAADRFPASCSRGKHVVLPPPPPPPIPPPS
jgi:hypothetical protein